MEKPFTFVSYARADVEFVLRLAKELRAKGVSLWLDQLDIIAGDSWEESIEVALEECQAVLLILSSTSLKSENVKDEISYALREKKKIIPLMYESCKIPLRLTRLHYVDFTVGDDMVGLLKALGIKTPSPVAENPTQPKPEPKKPVQDPKLEMVSIPGGSFMMGSKTFKKSQPIHKVTLKPFYMGKYQVTQAQWEAVMGNNPSRFKGDTLPVENVSWDDVNEFCKKLSKLTGEEYRLPSEAEWEYTARAGSSGDYCFGNDESLLPDYAWFRDNSDSKTHPVGQKKPNAWGLYDVHGNVWEWCQDVWHDSYIGVPDDGSACVIGGDSHVLRGGSWLDAQDLARAVCRYGFDPDNRVNFIGFRVVGVVRLPSQ